jgi:sugar phosphate isomerase/epimerase
MTASVREGTEIAGQAKVVMAFEPEMSNVVDSARKARRLLDEIGSPHLKVTIDPANLFHAGELPRMKEILDEAFDLIGRDAVLAHAKDLDRDGEAGHKPAGQGVLDYDRYMRAPEVQLQRAGAAAQPECSAGAGVPGLSTREAGGVTPSCGVSR